MNFNQEMDQNIQQARDMFYQNPGYQFERRKNTNINI